MSSQTSCPDCGRVLRVPDDLQGQRVRCPSCEHVFTAAAPEAPPPIAPRNDDLPLRYDSYRERAERDARRGDDAPRPRPGRLPLDDEDDDDFDVRPRRSRYAPHRGGTVLAVGIVSLVTILMVCPLCGFIGISAWVMGRNDLREMREGRMDPAGRGSTQAGYVMGIIATGLGGLTLLGFAAFIAIAAVT